MSVSKQKTVAVVTAIAAYLDAAGVPWREQSAPAPAHPTLADAIKALLYAQLSNQTRWATIAPKLDDVDALFGQYDRDLLLEHDPNYYVAGIRALKCGNRCIQRQMEGLAANIGTLEQVEADHGGFAAFLCAHPPEELVRLISAPGGAYKLNNIGYALAWQLLRSLGLDAAKPDVHLRRILGRSRLGFSGSAVAPEKDVNPIFAKMAGDTGLSVTLLDDMLWAFCASGYGGVCTAKPDCAACCARPYCRRGKSKKKSA